MRNQRVASLVLQAALCGLLLLSSGSPAVAATKTLTVTDPRPVAAAMRELERIYSVPITYEDTRYASSNETEDITEKLGRDLGRRVIIPKGGSLSFSYSLPALDATVEMRANLAANAITEALQKYNQSVNARMFTVTRQDGGFHVIAIEFIDQDGKMGTVTPILDTRISFSVPTPPNAAATMTAISEALNTAQNVRVWIGGVPSSLFYTTHVEMSATSETARDVLDRLMNELPSHVDSKRGPDGGTHNVHAAMSWVQLCDPDPQQGCPITFHIVEPTPSEKDFKEVKQPD